MRVILNGFHVDVSRYDIFGYSVPVFTERPEKPEVRILCKSCDVIIWGMADASFTNTMDAIGRHELDTHPALTALAV